MSDGTTARLYSYWRSSASWRVRIGLQLKGIAYEYRPVHLVQNGGEQHAEAYVSVNPNKLLPSLEIDGHVLSESLAILEYLDETRPEPPILPATPIARATARRVAESVNAGIQPIQNLRVLQYIGNEFGGDKVAWGRHWITVGFDAIEQVLASCAGEYAVGDAPSIADLCLVPQVYNARRFGVDMDRYPTIARIDATCAVHPAFQAAHPDVQPDAPKE